MYANEHDGKLPNTGDVDAAGGGLMSLYLPYLETPTIYHQCPAGPLFTGNVTSVSQTQYGSPSGSYLFKLALPSSTTVRYGPDDMPTPSRTCMLAETRFPWGPDYETSGRGYDRFNIYNLDTEGLVKDRHGDNGNYLFMDGRAVTIKAEHVEPTVSTYNPHINFEWDKWLGY